MIGACGETQEICKLNGSTRVEYDSHKSAPLFSRVRSELILLMPTGSGDDEEEAAS